MCLTNCSFLPNVADKTTRYSCYNIVGCMFNGHMSSKRAINLLDASLSSSGKKLRSDGADEGDYPTRTLLPGLIAQQQPIKVATQPSAVASLQPVTAATAERLSKTKKLGSANPYSRDNPPSQTQLFVPTRTKNRGNFLCVRLIAPPPDPNDVAAISDNNNLSSTTENGGNTNNNTRTNMRKKFTSDEAVGAWCTFCGDSVWWRKGESNGITRHMIRFHPTLLREGMLFSVSFRIVVDGCGRPVVLSGCAWTHSGK